MNLLHGPSCGSEKDLELYILRAHVTRDAVKKCFRILLDVGAAVCPEYAGENQSMAVRHKSAQLGAYLRGQFVPLE
jgi:hypothetical protein